MFSDEELAAIPNKVFICFRSIHIDDVWHPLLQTLKKNKKMCGFQQCPNHYKKHGSKDPIHRVTNVYIVKLQRSNIIWLSTLSVSHI